MADGFPPNYTMNLKRAMLMVPIKPPPTVSEPQKWSITFRDFLSKCLVKDHNHRPTAADLMSV
jgi:serine/threonine kinase 3